MPDELYDATRIDGGGHLRFLLQVVLPLSRAPLMVITVLTFMGSWNALAWPILVTTDEFKYYAPCIARVFGPTVAHVQVKNRYLGRKGQVQSLMGIIRELPNDQKPQAKRFHRMGQPKLLPVHLLDAGLLGF